MDYKQKVDVKAKHLIASSLIAAKQDVRAYLQGVLVGRGIIASTNGFQALICNEDRTSSIDEIIIPRESIKSLRGKLKTAGIKDGEDVDVTIGQLDADHWVIELSGNALEIFRPLLGTYPDIQKVDIEKPEQSQEEPANLCFKYLSVFSKCASYLGSKYLYITTRGKQDSAYIDFGCDVHGLLMPGRI